MGRVFRLLLFCGLVALVSLHAFSQDLGSSNKLFGTTKKAASAPTKSKRPTVKQRPAPAKSKAASRATAVAKGKYRPKTAKSVAKSKTESSSTKTTSKTASQVPSSAISPKAGKALNISPADQDKKTASGRFSSWKQKGGTPLSAKPGDAKASSSVAADELYERSIEEGNTARDDRNYSKAETAYKKGHAMKPNDPRAVFGLGNIFADQQRWDDAESAYRTALKLAPDDPSANIALSYVLSQPIMAPNLSDRYEEAERLARHATILNSSSALAFDQLGVTMELRGLISADTENAYRNAIRLDPSFAPPYAHLGRLLRRRGLAAESAASYQAAVDHATDVATMVLVADVMQSEQRFAESEPLLREAVAADSRNPTALLLLGHALTTTGNFVEAERYLRQGLEVSPNAFMPNILLGSLFARQGRYELAENALMQALRFVSANEKRRLSQEFEMVGDGYVKDRKLQNAAHAYKQAMTLDPENESLGAKAKKAQHS